VSVKSSKDSVTRKDTSGMKVTDLKPPTQTDTDKTTTTTEDSTAAVDVYRAKLAEKRRLAREKAEIEAEQQEERKRQQQ